MERGCEQREGGGGGGGGVERGCEQHKTHCESKLEGELLGGGGGGGHKQTYLRVTQGGEEGL